MESLKLLGVTVDSRLNVSEHVNSVCVKASQRIAVLMRLRNLILIKAKLQLHIKCEAAVLPYLYRKPLACGSWFTNSSRVLPTFRVVYP